LLHFASENGRADVVQILLDAKADTEASDSILMTPLHYACSNGHLAVLQVLIASGANMEATRSVGTVSDAVTD